MVFTIPLGDQGIHYEGQDNPEMLTWGPPAFTIAPDRTFWIADTADDHILQFDNKGALLGKIDTSEFMVGAGDIALTSREIWLLDMASIPPKLARLSLDRKILNTYDLPTGLHLEDGLSDIALGGDGSLLIERMGGHALTQFISPNGEVEQKPLEGYEFYGRVYAAHPASLSQKEASRGTIQAGEIRIDVEVTNALGGLRILHVFPDGSFLVEVVELVLDTAFRVDQKVFHYDSAGNLLGMARIPLASQYVPVAHSIAVSPEGEVYTLITRPDGGEIQRLVFYPDLPPILSPPDGVEQPEQSPTLPLSPQTCRSREAIIAVASEYLNNSTYLDAYHISDNAACSGRVKPRYLGSPGVYNCVPYAWNLWETVEQFNGFMSGGYNGYFAGNISETYLSCARGIDCSGLVSRAWGLSSHYGTCSLETISSELPNRYMLQPGDIMNRYDWPDRHAIIFHNFSGDGMFGYEATTYLITTELCGFIAHLQVLNQSIFVEDTMKCVEKSICLS